jgi:hypothetical protein
MRVINDGWLRFDALCKEQTSTLSGMERSGMQSKGAGLAEVGLALRAAREAFDFMAGQHRHYAQDATTHEN